ncbi:MAG: hypothetical protein OXG04_01450 [Acidobacteria bacterium]|nr:hypothetical protein [Acidobacteriota bacterium]
MRAAFDRASLGLTVFSNRYDDFIASTSLGLNPVTRPQRERLGSRPPGRADG